MLEIFENRLLLLLIPLTLLLLFAFQGMKALFSLRWRLFLRKHTTTPTIERVTITAAT